MKPTALLMMISVTAGAVAAGCTPPTSDVGSNVAAIKSCPPDGCAPPGTGDPPPPPPPKPTPPQPDPKKYRTAYLSADYIQNALNEFLYDTRLAISNTGSGPSIQIPSKMKSCTVVGKTPEEQKECVDDCNTEPDLTPAQRANCRAGCGSTTTCVDVCGAYSTTSYVQWGQAAKLASLKSSPKTCSSATCPACTTPTDVSSLDDLPLDVPPFSQSYGVGPASVDITCTVNRWMFHAINRNIKVVSTPVALYVTVPAESTGWPSVDCTNAPDPIVDGLSLTLQFAFPWSQSTVVTDATLDGNWHVIPFPFADFITDMSGRISDGVKSSTHDMLNTPANQKTFWSAFASITAQWVAENTSETFDKLGYIESDYGQLKVTYWVK